MDKPKHRNYGETARCFRVMAHPARLRMLAALRYGEECVCHLEALLRKPQAYVSQQLSVLRDAGLVHDRKDGQRVYYAITDERVLPVLDAFLVEVPPQGHGPIRPVRERVEGCRCPKCAIEIVNARWVA